MKRLLLNAIIFLALSAATSGAQDKINIHNDPAIVSGKTPSGLTYYLINRSSGNGTADFYLLRKAGSASGQPSYSGIAGLLNSVSLYETRSFPGGTLPSIIHHTGASLRESLVSVTEDDYCLTGIKNIPTGAVPSACDSALLVLLNFSGGAEILEENAGRDSTFHNNAMLPNPSRTTDRNIRENFLTAGDGVRPFPPSRDGNAEDLFSLPASEIRKYYRGWSRPDLQAAIIIGDFDVNSVRNSLNILFSTLPRATEAFKSEMVQVPVTPGAETFIFKTDRESDIATVSIHFLSAQLPRDRRGTQAVLVDDYLDSVLMELIRHRIKDALPSLAAPVYSYQVRCGNFLGLEQTDDIVCELRTSPESVQAALSFLSGVVEGVRAGVTAKEYADASLLHLTTVGQYRSGIRIPSNEYYLRGCLRHFLLGYTIPSWSDRSKYAVRINSSFDWKRMNDYLTAFIDEDTHKIITVTSPDILSEPELKTAYMAGRHIPKILNLSQSKSASAQIPDPTSVSLKKASSEPITKSYVYSLPNGASVIFKKNGIHKGELCFEAFSRGGISLARNGFRTLDRYINRIAELSVPGCSDTSTIELTRSFTGSMSFLTGRCDEKDLEDFFRMIRGCFSPSPVSRNEFTSLMSALTLRDAKSFRSPDTRFDMMASDYVIPAEDRLTLNYQMAQEFINTCFTAAGDFTFLFCGDISEDKIKLMTERYLSSLPGRTGKRKVPSPGAFHIERYDQVREASMEMESPRHFLGLRLTASRKYDLPSSMKSKLIARILQEEISEEMFRSGIIINCSEQILTYPEECLSVDFRLVSPRNTEGYEKILDSIIKRIGSEGVPIQRIQNAKNTLSASLARAEKSDNRFWIDILEARYINGKDFYTLQNKTLSAISEAEVNEELKMFLSESRRIITRLHPEIIETPQDDNPAL